MFAMKNYTGRDQRFVRVENGKLKVVRCYVSCGRAYLNATLTPGCAMDGVATALLMDVVQGLPLRRHVKDRPDEVDNEIYIVRKDVALAMLQRPSDQRSRCLVPFDPVMVPASMRFSSDVNEGDCKMASGLLNDPEGAKLQADGYVCYGYRRLAALTSEDVVPVLPLVFPTSESEWPTVEARREEIRQVVAGLRRRFDAVPGSTDLSNLKSAISLAEAKSDLFKVGDAELSRLLLQLEQAELTARIDGDPV